MGDVRGLAARYSVFVMPVCQETPVRLVVAGCRCAGALARAGVLVAFNRSGQLIDGCIPPLAVLVILVYPLRCNDVDPAKRQGTTCAPWLHSVFHTTVERFTVHHGYIQRLEKPGGEMYQKANKRNKWSSRMGIRLRTILYASC